MFANSILILVLWLHFKRYESEVKHWGNVFDTEAAAADLGYTLTGAYAYHCYYCSTACTDHC